MYRRAFLKSLIGGVVATSAVQTWPFRVFSFPPKPILANTRGNAYQPIYYDRLAIDALKSNITFTEFAQKRLIPKSVSKTVQIFQPSQGPFLLA